MVWVATLKGRQELHPKALGGCSRASFEYGRGYRLRPLAAPAFAIALLQVAAFAAADAISLESEAPVSFEGAFEASGAAGVLYSWAREETGAIVATGLEGTLRVWTERQVGFVAAKNGGFQNREHADVEEIDVQNGTLRIDFHGRGAAYTVLVAAEGIGRVAGAVDAQGAPYTPPAEYVGRGEVAAPPPYRTAELAPWSWGDDWPFIGHYALDNVRLDGFPPLEAAAFAAEGALTFDAVNGEATLTVPGAEPRTWQLGFSDVLHSSEVGYGGTVTSRTLRFDGVAARLDAPVGEHWGYAAPAMDWALDGSASWLQADGEASRGSETVAFEGARVRLAGSVVLATTPGGALSTVSGEGATYEGEGAFSSLTVNGAPVGSGPVVPPAAAAAGVSLAALLAALLLEGPRAILLRVALALYTRLAREDLLAHPRRAAIHRAIAERPGIHLRELHRVVGGGWGIFRAHFDLLLRAGYLRVVPQGKYVAVYLASAGTETPAIPSDVARAAFEAIPADGRAIPVADVRAASGASRQLLNYHLKTLEQRGLVRFTEDARGSRCVARAAAASIGEDTAPKANVPESA